MNLLRAWINRTRKMARIWLRPRVTSLPPILKAIREGRAERLSPERYTADWYARIYADLGTGFLRSGGSGVAPGVGSATASCLKCPRGVVLGLLPGEEAMFRDTINQTDFRLGDNPALPGRKTITCGKLGHCGGHMPYVCRTSPAQFSRGLFYVDESRCATGMTAFLAENGAEVKRLRGIVRAHGLHLETLGYRRVVPDNGHDAQAREEPE